MSEVLAADQPKVVLGKPYFWAPGEFKMLGDNHQLVVSPFRAKFRRLSVSEANLVMMRLDAARRDNASLLTFLEAATWLPDGWHERTMKASEEERPLLLAEFRLYDKGFLDLILLDWELKDLDGAPTPPYSAEARAAVFDQWDGLESAFCRAYFDAKRMENPEKNSVTPSAAS